MKIKKTKNPFQIHKNLFPVSYNFVEITDYNTELITEELPVSLKVDLYQTNKFVPYSFYKPFTSGVVLNQKNDEEGI